MAEICIAKTPPSPTLLSEHVVVDFPVCSTAAASLPW
jgi:hypothetical protein